MRHSFSRRERPERSKIELEGEGMIHKGDNYGFTVQFHIGIRLEVDLDQAGADEALRTRVLRIGAAAGDDVEALPFALIRGLPQSNSSIISRSGQDGAGDVPLDAPDLSVVIRK